MQSFKSYYLIEDINELDLSKHDKLLLISSFNDKIPFMSFNLPAGATCPFAEKCHAFAVPDEEGKLRIKDGANIEYRCYAASMEVTYPATFKQRMYNLALLKNCKSKQEMASLIYKSLIENKVDKVSKYFRLHVSGDFFSQDYFDCWLSVAKKIPDTIFYCYTKSIPFWIKRYTQIPNNFKLTASYGGKTDALIQDYNLKYVVSVDSVADAKKLGLEIDVDDSHAYSSSQEPFALLVHGIQPKGHNSYKHKKDTEQYMKQAKSIKDISNEFDFPEEEDETI